MQQSENNDDMPEMADEYDFSEGVRGKYAERFNPTTRATLEVAALFTSAMDWLRDHYADYHFFYERDIVWTLQNYIIQQIHQQQLPYKVFNDYPMLPGQRADLVICAANKMVLLAAEFKYEPEHKRAGDDIMPSKFPAVFWGNDGVGKDVKRIQQFVAAGKCQVAYAIFIDEGGAFRHRPAHPGSVWLNWELTSDPPQQVAVLWARAMALIEEATAPLIIYQESA